VKDENCHLLADSHNIFNRWKKYFCQLLDVMQTEMHAAEPLAYAPSSFEIEITTGKLKRYKSPGIAQVLAELVQAGCNMRAV
jgi:hypothetical protein